MILFDGVCNLCNGYVQFVIGRDPLARFQFAPLQSGAADRLLGRREARGDLPDSIFLVQDGRVFTRSAAALRILRGLRFPWPLAFALIVVPRPLRDWIYDRVALNRYALFGRSQSCMMPTPESAARFLP